MSFLHNNPEDFAQESLTGFVLAHPDVVKAVPGGVVRATRTAQNHVAIVIGGGSGHFPAFSGLVGKGLAHGAAVGNVFASPSSSQVYSVARAVENGGGVLFLYGNYAGDVLNFEAAKKRLIDEGVPCESVAVTDDVASATVENSQERRGVAGDLVVFKVAADAADAGSSLAEVTDLARLANSRTRSLGIAFSGCTLPGADRPLFEVAPGTMEVGMGIHGEPGLESLPLASAASIAQLLVDRLLPELARDTQDVALILSGLGSVKYEELYLLYGHIADLLAGHGLSILEPEVGELVTSFEMAGVSLTLCALDERLKSGWCAPAYTAAYRKKAVGSAAEYDDHSVPVSGNIEARTTPGTEESQHSAKRILRAMAAVRDELVEREEELGALDAVAGDGDHGIGMLRGATAGAAAAELLVEQQAGAATVLRGIADAWSDKSGGTSGAIWGVILRSLAEHASDDTALTPEAIVAGVRAAAEGVKSFGGANVGDKTVVDALDPLADTLGARFATGGNLAASWADAVGAAVEAADATKNIVSRTGRSKKHGEKSLGTPDPGAYSLSLISRRLLSFTEGES